MDGLMPAARAWGVAGYLAGEENLCSQQQRGEEAVSLFENQINE